MMISLISLRIYAASLAAVDKATYSASVQLKAMTLCFFDSHEITAPAARNVQLMYDFRYMQSPVQLDGFSSPLVV